MIRCSAYLPLRSLASFLALTVVGCSAANRIPVSVASESAPTSPEAAYGEMAALERVIARDRARLGLPARPAKPGENLAAAAVNSPRDKRNAPKSSTAETAQKEDDQPAPRGERQPMTVMVLGMVVGWRGRSARQHVGSVRSPSILTRPQPTRVVAGPSRIASRPRQRRNVRWSRSSCEKSIGCCCPTGRGS